MSKTNNTVPGSINLRGEIISWTDESGRKNAVVEMMASGVSWLPVLGTDERLYAVNVPCRTF